MQENWSLQIPRILTIIKKYSSLNACKIIQWAKAEQNFKKMSSLIGINKILSEESINNQYFVSVRDSINKLKQVQIGNALVEHFKSGDLAMNFIKSRLFQEAKEK